MGCFFACFGSSKKHHKTKKPESLTSPKNQNLNESHEVNEALICSNQADEEGAEIADPIEVIPEIKGKNEEQVSTSFGKKVTFDLLLKAPEECQAQEGALENDQKRKKRDESRPEVILDFPSSSEKKEGKAKKEESKDEADLLSDSTISSLFTYPPNHRYQNCESSDDECVDMGLKKNNPEDEEHDGKSDDNMDGNYEEKNGSEDSVDIQEESSELFSISIESRKQSSAVERDEKEVSSPLKPASDREVNRPNARDRTQYVHPVLNPIENLGQWKAVRAKTTSSLEHQEKENLNLVQEFTIPCAEKENSSLTSKNPIPFSEEPNPNQSQQQRSKRFSNRLRHDEVAVDTSLSSWLMESDKTPPDGNSPGSVGNSAPKKTESPTSFEDRPILGVLTVEDLKQMSKSATPSPRRSPRHSPDEMPIIGTVGSYWRHTREARAADTRSPGKGTSVTSCTTSRECRKGGMNGHHTPFQARLERTLDGATVQV
ncbi:uncharacterized protein [Coffea arabica]|uniref:Uncharacterized protein n=1 Tax=Coffea arabica TaxID=13443 RepID=A0A6P6VNL4_COFAR|nr:uncharacterized protein LOC113725564 [Coffea arabica]